MKLKTTRVFILAFFVVLAGCSSHAYQAPAAADNAGDILTAEKCLEFMESKFCPVWETAANNMRHVEYLSDTESLESWTQMITVRRYGGAAELKEVLPGYIKSVRPMIALKPEFYSKGDSAHVEDLIVFLVLKAPDNSHIEVVTNHYYHDGGGTIWSVFHSYRMPFAQQVEFTEVMKRRPDWFREVSEIDAASVLAE